VDPHAVLPAFALFVAPGAFVKKKPPTQPINTDTAISDPLQQVPGIGSGYGSENFAEAQTLLAHSKA